MVAQLNDASDRAFAVLIYLKLYQAYGKLRDYLVRFAPAIRQLHHFPKRTCLALLTDRLVFKVKIYFRLENAELFFEFDAQIVLH